MNAIKNLLIKFNRNLNLNLIMNLTILFFISYFLTIRVSNANWINDYFSIVFLFSVFFAYFIVFASLYIFKTCYANVKYKIIFQHLNIILLPLVICFAITFAYFLCITVCEFNKIFYSLKNFCQYSLLAIFFIIAPTVMVSQTRYIIRQISDMVKRGLITERY